MKKYLFLLSLLISGIVSAQYQVTGTKLRYYNGLAVSTRDTIGWNPADSNVMIIGSDSSVYIRNKGYWKKIPLNSNVVNYSDTSSMLSHYAKGVGISGYIPKWTGTTTQDTSQIFQINGGIAIGTNIDSTYKLNLLGNQMIKNATASKIALQIHGASSQTADLFRISKSDGTVYQVATGGGNFGFGTGTPGALVEVSGTAAEIRLRNTATSDAILRYYVNGLEAASLRANSSRDLTIETAGTAHAKFLSSGRTLLGPTLPTDDGTSELQVNGEGLFASDIILTATNARVRTNTVDGTDNKRLQLAAADASGTRGAYINLYGNEYDGTTNDGNINLIAGSPSSSGTGFINFLNAGVESGRFSRGGNLLLGSVTDDGVSKLQVTGSVKINATITGNPALTVSGAITAGAGVARGQYVNNQLYAAADNDVLVGLDINPTFTNGAFTGVSNTGLRITTTSDNQLKLNGTSGVVSQYFTSTNVKKGQIFYDISNDIIAFGGASSTTKTQLLAGNGSVAVTIPNTNNVLIGSTTDNGTDKLQVTGSAKFTGTITAPIGSWDATGIVINNIRRNTEATMIFTGASATVNTSFDFQPVSSWSGVTSGSYIGIKSSMQFAATGGSANFSGLQIANPISTATSGNIKLIDIASGVTETNASSVTYGVYISPTVTTSGKYYALVTNGAVGINTGTPNASSALDITSTTQGFLNARMTTTQRDAIATPATGLSVYNTTTNTNDFYNGTAWATNAVDASVVHLAGAETITGAKTFTSNLTVGSTSGFIYDIANSSIQVGASGTTWPIDINVPSFTGRYKSSTGTNRSVALFENTGGSFYTGLENSTGVNFTGSPYAGVIWHTGNAILAFGNNNTERARFSTAGNFLLGSTTDNGTDKLQITGSSKFTGNATFTGFITPTSISAGKITFTDASSNLAGSSSLMWYAYAANNLGLYVAPLITASSSIARGEWNNSTLTAAANSDKLVALDISPTFTNGAFTSVSNIALRTTAPYTSLETPQVRFVSTSTASALELVRMSGTTESQKYQFITGYNGTQLELYSQSTSGGTYDNSVMTFFRNGNVGVGIGSSGDNGASFSTKKSVTASAALAQGLLVGNTLVAAANNDVLVGLDISPTFTNGAFTGVTNRGLRVQTGGATISGTAFVNGDNGLTVNTTTNNSVAGTLYGINNTVTANTNASNISGVNSSINSTTSAVTMVGVQGAVNISANTITEGKGFSNGSAATGTGTFTTYIGYDHLNVFKSGSGAITRQYGFRSQLLTNGTGANIGLLLNDAAPTTVNGNWGIYDQSGYNSYFGGRFLIGSNTDNGTDKLQVTGSSKFTGNVTATGNTLLSSYSGVGNISSGAAFYISLQGMSGGVQNATAANTTDYNAFDNYASVNASSAVTNLTGFTFRQNSLGAGASVTNQTGFNVNPLTWGTNIYAYRGQVASGTGRYNLYMDGTANNYMAGSLGIGSASLTGQSLRISKNITGATTSYGIYQDEPIQSDVTNQVIYNHVIASTAASVFTLAALNYYNASQGTFGAGSTVTQQTAYNVAANFIGATTNYGYRGLIPNGSGRYNLYMDGTAPNFVAGNFGIGSTSLAQVNLRISNTITGSASSYGIYQEGQIQSDVTNQASYFQSNATTAVAAFTLSNLYHYLANQSTIGAGSAVTTQSGFTVSSSLSGAATNIGFSGNVGTSQTTNRNLFMSGAAPNYLAAALMIGSNVNNGTDILQVTGSSKFTGALTSGFFTATVSAGPYVGLIQNTSTATTEYNAIRFMQGATGSAIGVLGTGGSATSNTAFRNSFVVGTQNANDLVFNTNDVERARISSTGAASFQSTATFSGNVAINTSTLTNAKLQITSATSSNIILENTAATTGKSWQLNSYSDGKLYFGVFGVADYFNLAPTTGNATFSGTVTASSIIKSGGTSSQYLMADGSVSTISGATGVVATGTLTAQTTGQNIATYTAPSDGMYMIGGQLRYNSGTGTSPTVDFQYTYTDENNTAQSFELFAIGSGSNGGAAYTAGWSPKTIYVKSGTVITIKTGILSGTPNYNAQGFIQKIF